MTADTGVAWMPEDIFETRIFTGLPCGSPDVDPPLGSVTRRMGTILEPDVMAKRPEELLRMPVEVAEAQPEEVNVTTDEETALDLIKRKLDDGTTVLTSAFRTATASGLRSGALASTSGFNSIAAGSDASADVLSI